LEKNLCQSLVWVFCRSIAWKRSRASCKWDCGISSIIFTPLVAVLVGSEVLNGEHLHDFVAEVVDDFDGDAAGGGSGEGAGDGFAA
jgi:hypothetical protein